MFAYIPARGGSKRIVGKNIRQLAGVPVLHRVINNLKSVPGLSGICVSSEDTAILECSRKITGVETLALRCKTLSTDESGFTDLILKDLPRYAAHYNDKDVLFVLATAALVKPSTYSRGKELFEKDLNSLVMAVGKYSVSPRLALNGALESNLVPCSPESYKLPTKDLGIHYFDSGSFYVFNLDMFLKRRSFFGFDSLKGCLLSQLEAVDVDTPEDWEQLETNFKLLT